MYSAGVTPLVTLPRRTFGPLISIALATGIYGCGGDKLTLPGNATPANILMVTGDAQAGIVGTVLPLPLVVKVTDELGRAVVDQSVQFTVQSGGGQVAPGSVTTGSEGRASATWTLGPNAGAQQVQAQAVGGGAPADLAVSFSATAISGSGTLIAAASGDDQSAPVNSALSDSLVVKVSDSNNNPVGGITIQWTAVGGGSVSPETVVTGADGLAATARVLGPTSGQQSAQASSDGLAGSPVTFVHTAVASNPTTLTEVSGNGQTAPAGFEVAEDLVVRLTDTDGNGVGGLAVTWVPAPSGTPNPLNSTTDPSGFARTRWTLGATAGQYTLTAVYSGNPPVAPVLFSATASSDVPAKIAIVSGNNQSAAGGTTLANPLVVKVTDANDNPVENVPVAWTANDGSFNGAASTTTATNAQGTAQIDWTLGPALGPQTATAGVSGLTGSPLTFNATATVGAAAKIVVIQQPSGTAVNGVAFTQQPVVQVQDAAGNNVGPAGRLISAVLVNAEGDLNGTRNRQTNPTGQAVYTNLNITGPVGSYTLRFSSGTLDDAFSDPVILSAGAPNAVQSTVEASPAAVEVGETSTITVTAKDAGGNPVSGVTVVLLASGGGNTIGQPAGPTDANGQATGTFSSTGIGNHTITATLNGSTTVSDNAIVAVTVPPPASIAAQAGDGQSATAGTPVSTDPAVLVSDGNGAPVSGVQVTFAVASGGGSVTGATPTTNASGVATVGSWTLGATAGTNTLTATISGSGISGNPVTFTATGTAGGPSASQSTLTVDQVIITAGGAGSTVTVTAKDAGGNPISGATVALSATGSGNSFTAPGLTDGSGVTTSTYTSTEAGDHTISAQINGLLIDATAVVTVQAGAAATLTFTTSPPALVQTGNAFTVVVAISDAFGNPTDASVQMALNQDTGAILGGTLSVASVNGSATFSDLTVDQATGLNPYTLTASASATAASPGTSTGFFAAP